MICPHCNDKTARSKILDSRMVRDRKRRRRECQFCGGKFTTYEYVDFYPGRNCGTPVIPKKKKPGPKAGRKDSPLSESNWLQRFFQKLEAQ